MICILTMLGGCFSQWAGTIAQASDETEWLICNFESALGLAKEDGSIYGEKKDLNFNAPQNVAFDNLALCMNVNLSDETAVAAMKGCTVELSQNQMDVAELQWSLKEKNLQVGENEVYLYFNDAESRTLTADEYFDLTKTVNYFRIFGGSKGTGISVSLSALKLVKVDTTEAGLKFGKTDTYLQLSNAVNTTPNTIEASVKMDEVKWNVLDVTDITTGKTGSGYTTDVDEPGAGVAYASMSISAGTNVLVDMKLSVPSFGIYQQEDLALAFWYYANEAGTMPAGEIELGSSTNTDQYELCWKTQYIQVEAGWNHVILPLGNASVPNPEMPFSLNNMCRLRWFTQSEKTFKISDMELVPYEQTTWTLVPVDVYNDVIGTGKAIIDYWSAASGPGVGAVYTDVTLDASVVAWLDTTILTPNLRDYTAEELALSFWYYADDAGTIPSGQIELGSSTSADTYEIYWKTKDISVTKGWNYIELPLSSGLDPTVSNLEDQFELGGLKRVRWYKDSNAAAHFKVSALTVKVMEDKNVSEWTIAPATICNGSSAVADRGTNGPDENWNVVEVSTSQQIHFEKTNISAPNFGEYTEKDIVLAFWYYSYETSITNLPAGQLELRSEQNNDSHELQWRPGNLVVKPGWNYIELPLSCYYSKVGFDLTKLCGIRWYRDSYSAEWKFKLSDMKLVVKETAKTSWTMYDRSATEAAAERQGGTMEVTISASNVANGAMWLWNSSNFTAPELATGKYAKEDLALAFWYYSYIDGALPAGEIEVTSGGQADVGELRVNPAAIQVKTGWNYIVVPLTDMIEHANNVNTPFDVKNINYLRWIVGQNAVTDTWKFHISQMKLIALESETDVALQVTEDVQSSSVKGNMIFSNTNTDDATYALFVTEKGYPALLWGATQFTLTQSVKTGDWVDIAAVYQDNKVSFYIDGILAGEVEGITLSSQTFETKHCIGADGSGNNLMVGSIADIRLWSDARTAGEIKQYRVAKKGNTTSGLTSGNEGLIGNWFLFGDSQYILEDMKDVCGNTAIYRGTRAEDWYDYDKNEHTFLGDDYWSLVFIPDIQNLTRGEETSAKIWYETAQWIADNVETEKIKHVIGAGDTSWNDIKGEYDIAMNGFSKFDEKVPFSNLIGNHDYQWNATYRNSEKYQNYFGLEYIKDEAHAISKLEMGYYSDTRAEENTSQNITTTTENSYYRFTVNDAKWMILQLEYHPRKSVIAWADEILKKYPNDNVILATHGYIDGEGNYITEDMTYLNSNSTGDGTDYITSTGEIWTELKDNSNIKFILCGHCTSDTGAITVREETNDEGRIVKALMINAQDLDASNVEDTAYYTDRPLGMLSILRFSKDGSQVAVQYYSPHDNKSFNPLDTVGSTERTTKDLTMEYGLEPYIVSYQSATAGTAPTDAADYKARGYVFAGWYTDENCTKVLSGAKNDTVYAKYVHADMLSVKAQVRLDKATNAVPADVTDMRFVTTVDSLKYQKVGFEIQVADGKINSKESQFVYKELYAVGDGKKEGEEKNKITYTPYDEFDLQANYFNTHTVYNIGSKYYNTKFTVRAFWITQDGTTVYGEYEEKYVKMNNVTQN